MGIHQKPLTDISAENMNHGREMTKKHRDRTEPKYKALDMTEHALKVAIRTIDRHVGEGYAKAHPELISAFMTTTAANFATLTEREIAEVEQVTTINVKTGEQTA